MFPSSPSDKSYVGPDNCASGRNNASCRFPVGITSLGDENQHIRIQLAVNKYNSSANNSLDNRCAVISPVRHSFLKNSLKAKDYEGETERMSKNEKKNGNQYEGVGAFPTIHLRKSAIRYRPIRRFNDVKIPYPELPVNRFLSHLPEVCPDLKSSPRSVLDVLEDLSGKKIHLKEDNRGNKSKAKGLGGEFFSNPNAVYKPLFVQKPKSSTVLTRDNTTQTLSPLGVEASTLQSNNSFMRNEASDPRAELRRKLAKQNNEIFASLSSSILSFALKRKRDKILPVKEDENPTDGSSAKKSKITNDQQKDVNENGVSKFMSWSKTNSINSTKLNRKNKLMESNSPTSPNKDRLTTIFLDMQNTNSKAQMFDGNLSTSDRKSLENNSQSSAINGLKSRVDAPNFNGSLGTKATENKEDESALKYCSSLGFAEKVTSLDAKKQENVQPNKPMFNTPTGKEKIPNDLLKSASPTFQMGVNGSNTSNFSFSKTSEPLQIGNISNLSNTSLNKTMDGNDKEKKDTDCQVLDKPITSESSNDKPNFSSFKFGAENNISPGGGSSSKDLKTLTSEANLKSVSTASSSPLRFAFATSTSVSTFPSQTSSFKVDDTKTQETSTTPAKPLCSFGKNTSPSELSTETVKFGEKNQMSNGVSPSVAESAQNIQPVVFNFGQKSNADSSVHTVDGQSFQNMTSPTGQSNVGFLPSDNGLNANTSTAAEKNKSSYTFGQKTETPATSTSQVTASEEQKFSFSFGKKSDPEKNKPQEGFDLKSSSLFAFGQKSTSQESTQSVAVSTNVTSPSQVPPQDSAQNIVVSNVTSQNQSASTQSSSLIGQTLPAASAAPMAFSQTLTSQITNGFGAKSEASTLGTGNTAPAFNQSNSAFPAKTPLFGSTGGFGNATTQATFSFGTSTSGASGFGFGAPTTTQPPPTFGVSSAPQTGQTGSVFQPSTTSPSISGFGNSCTTQTTPAFGGSTLNPTSTFGVSVTTQSPSTFGVSSTTQSAPTFGATSAAESITTFGTSTSSPSFGVPSTTQSTSAFGASSTQSAHTFGTSTGFGVSSPSQPDSLFGVPVSSPSAVRFGAITTQNNNGFGASPYFSTASSTLPNTSFGAPVATATSEFGTTQSSFSQPFGNKPVPSLGQTSSIFGQNLASTFSSNTGFSNDQNNLFGQKSSTEGSVFNQNKTQTPVFGGATQGFGAQNKLSFGISTTNVTGFSASPPNTTAAPVFNFGGSTTENTFAFGSNTSGSNNSQSAFAFKSPSNEPFKFGATTTKEGPGFGGTNTATFAFGSGQMNNNTIAEPKPTFNFGSAQVSSSGPFNFGTTPSPAVFSFGGSTSAGSGSSFSFGTPNPTPDAPFGQNPTPSPAAPFSVPGTFCIGSGSSQSRPRATSRPRRRP